VLEPSDLARIGSVAALQLEVFTDGFIEQSHDDQTLARAGGLYTGVVGSARIVRFLPVRLAR
jgi:hypothetical protein